MVFTWAQVSRNSKVYNHDVVSQTRIKPGLYMFCSSFFLTCSVFVVSFLPKTLCPLKSSTFATSTWNFQSTSSPVVMLVSQHVLASPWSDCLICFTCDGSALPGNPLVYKEYKYISLGCLVSVLGGEEGYTVKYGLNPREFPRAQPEGTPEGSGSGYTGYTAIFCRISRVES